MKTIDDQDVIWTLNDHVFPAFPFTFFCISSLLLLNVLFDMIIILCTGYPVSDWRTRTYRILSLSLSLSTSPVNSRETNNDVNSSHDVFWWRKGYLGWPLTSFFPTEPITMLHENASSNDVSVRLHEFFSAFHLFLSSKWDVQRRLWTDRNKVDGVSIQHVECPFFKKALSDIYSPPLFLKSSFCVTIMKEREEWIIDFLLYSSFWTISLQLRTLDAYLL